MSAPSPEVLACVAAHGGDFDAALEALQARGLAPPDDGRRSWACPCCGGADPERRQQSTEVAWRTARRCIARRVLGGDGPQVSTLEAVASLGVAAWLRAESLARVVAPGADVLWSAPGAEALRRSLHGAALAYAVRPSAADVAGSVALTALSEFYGEDRPWAGFDPPGGEDRARWEAAEELRRDLGVHLLRVDPPMAVRTVRVDPSRGALRARIDLPARAWLAAKARP